MLSGDSWADAGESPRVARIPNRESTVAAVLILTSLFRTMVGAEAPRPLVMIVLLQATSPTTPRLLISTWRRHSRRYDVTDGLGPACRAYERGEVSWTAAVTGPGTPASLTRAAKRGRRRRRPWPAKSKENSTGVGREHVSFGEGTFPPDLESETSLVTASPTAQLERRQPYPRGRLDTGRPCRSPVYPENGHDRIAPGGLEHDSQILRVAHPPYGRLGVRHSGSTYECPRRGFLPGDEAPLHILKSRRTCSVRSRTARRRSVGTPAQGWLRRRSERAAARAALVSRRLTRRRRAFALRGRLETCTVARANSSPARFHRRSIARMRRGGPTQSGSTSGSLSSHERPSKHVCVAHAFGGPPS